MHRLEFVPLHSVPERDLIDLMNEPLVARHLPLLQGRFTAEDCRAFVAAKQDLWRQHAYGPWAFSIDGAFAGWGGLQAEDGEADFALVLHPRFWGWGLRIFRRVRDQAFQDLALPSITLLLPPSRVNAAVVRRLGFEECAATMVAGAQFRKFRLLRPA